MYFAEEKSVSWIRRAAFVRQAATWWKTKWYLSFSIVLLIVCLIVVNSLGLHLSSELQEKVKELKKKLTQLEIEFGKNLSEEKSSFEFSEAELSESQQIQYVVIVWWSLGGLSEDFIKSLNRTDDSKCVLTLKYPHYIPVAQKCTNPQTRATLECAFNSRCVCMCVVHACAYMHKCMFYVLYIMVDFL